MLYNFQNQKKKLFPSLRHKGHNATLYNYQLVNPTVFAITDITADHADKAPYYQEILIDTLPRLAFEWGQSGFVTWMSWFQSH